MPIRWLASLLVLAPSLHAQGPAAAQWPQFRGPQGRGIALDDRSYPVRFGPEQNVVWKTPLPAGLSSPVIWGDRIFITAVDGQHLQTIALDRKTGKVLWRRHAPTEKIERVNKV